MTNRFTELLTILEGDAFRFFELSSKRRETIIEALRVANASDDLKTAMVELLQYTGGWDLPLHGDHPISKARLALKKAGVTL